MPQEVVWSDLQGVGDTSSRAEVSVDGLNPVDAAARGGVLQHRSQTFKHIIGRASPIMLTVYYDTYPFISKLLFILTSGTSTMYGRFKNSGFSSLTSVINTLTFSTTWRNEV